MINRAGMSWNTGFTGLSKQRLKPSIHIKSLSDNKNAALPAAFFIVIYFYLPDEFAAKIIMQNTRKFNAVRGLIIFQQAGEYPWQRQ